MKRLIFGFACLGSCVWTLNLLHGEPGATDAPAGANASAYTALRVMAKELGRDSLDRVVEVAGRDGSPQPYLWKIVLLDGQSGTREVDVAGGKIAAQRTESKPPPSKSNIHLADLNLDSSGAFDATDAQARKVHLRFDSVNYVLRTSDTTGKPQWTLNLLNQEGGDVGAMRLSASDGNILSIDGRLATGPAPRPHPPAHIAANDHPHDTVTSSSHATESHTTTTTTVVDAPPPPPPPVVTTTTVEDVPDDREEGGLFTRAGRTIDKTNRTVESSLRRAGAKVQRFFTGHSDLDHDEARRAPEDNGTPAGDQAN